MTIMLPNLRVGTPVCHEALAVFPLFTDTVENKGNVRVLFIEGEELVGAKQNRILNTSVLIAAHTKTKIPVSCVEQGRWGYRSRSFGSSGSHSPSRLRRALKASVSESVRMKRGHRSDQGEVWREVASLHASHHVSSNTAAMSDCFDSYRDRIGDFRQRLQYVDGATGMAVAVGGHVVSVDVFDKPETCGKVWDRLLSGVVFDALEAGEADQPADAAAVERLLENSRGLSWEPTEAVGEGVEYRASSSQGDHASALVFEGVLVHGSVLAV